MNLTLMAMGFGMVVLVSGSSLEGATAAFCGEVTKTGTAPPNDKEGLNRFTVKIDYYDYISRGKFGRDSKIGEEIEHRILRRGTVCVLNGELMNAQSFAAAMKPGSWGYFYENTWLDLFTTPNFMWGEVLEHDAAKRTVKLRVHRTHKEIHLAANPPHEEVLSYASARLRLEEKDATPSEAFKVGHWVQVHPMRDGTVDMRTKASQWSRTEWLPQEEGRRGYANDLSGPAVIKAVRTRDPARVIDNSVQLELERDGELETIDCRSTTFVLDGKLCPPAIAARPGRSAVLCYYRRDKAPHKILLSSIGDRQRAEFPGGDLPAGAETAVTWLLDGRPSTREDILKSGGTVTVFPRRGKMLIAFPPHDVPEPEKKK